MEPREGEYDVRIRHHGGDYRIVAPNAKESGGKEYVNGNLIMEVRTKDGLGAVSWRTLRVYDKPGSDDSLETRAEFYFLSRGAADAQP